MRPMNSKACGMTLGAPALLAKQTLQQSSRHASQGPREYGDVEVTRQRHSALRHALPLTANSVQTALEQCGAHAQDEFCLKVSSAL